MNSYRKLAAAALAVAGLLSAATSVLADDIVIVQPGTGDYGIEVDPSFLAHWTEPEPGPGATVCLYTGRQFTGQSLCVAAGTSEPSLRRWNDQISSFEVFEGASVTVCTDPWFEGYCTTYTHHRATLSHDDDDISSFEVN
jgi:Beta/Gamma crystallin.